MSKQEDDIEYVIAGLRTFDGLVRKNTDEVGWIAFKLGCSPARASRLVAIARERMAAGKVEGEVKS